MKALLLILTLVFQASTLSNADIIQMTLAGFAPETIIAKIKTSKSSFDTSPTSLTDLKSKGVAESVLRAMIDTERPALVSDETNNQEAAIKALRRLANGVEIGVNLADYSALVADAKTELESSLKTITSDSFKASAMQAMAEYQFAASVWLDHRTSEDVYGEYKDLAIKQYGVKPQGWMKVVSRNNFLQAIWREARRHYEAALYSTEARANPRTPTATLVGTWLIRTVSATSPQWSGKLTIFDGAQVLGYLELERENSRIRSVSLQGNRFHLELKDKNGPVLDGQIVGNQIQGTATLIKNNTKIVADFVGTRLP